MNWNQILQTIKNGNAKPKRRVEKTQIEWASLLPQNVYGITREKGTESPYSDASCTLFEKGVYTCACCQEPLFNSAIQYDSGSGWPSFTAPITDATIKYLEDYSLGGRQRIEVQCNVCDAHLGHVFPDGPPPNGLRFCINALALIKQ